MNTHDDICDLLQRILAAYWDQRDPIADSDLDDEQRVLLSVRITLGDIRAARRFVSSRGNRPVDRLEPGQ